MKNYNKEILDHVIHIKEDVAGIKEHLRQLNSKVAKHELDIANNLKEDNLCHKEFDYRIKKIDLTMAKWMGAVGVLVVVVNILVNRFLL